MKSPETKDETAGFAFVLSVLAIVPVALWVGFVLQKLWAWFVVDFGLPRIGVWHAAGLSLLVRLLATTSRPDDEDERSAAEQFGRTLAFAIIWPAVALGAGALYHAFGG